jgi:HSP20 family protein
MTLVKWKKPSINGQSTNPLMFNSAFSDLVESFFNNDVFPHEFAQHVPAANMIEEDSKYHLELSAPGFDKSDFKIELQDQTLSVSAEHKTVSESKDKKYSRKEFNYGSFKRNFYLPQEINEEGIEAKYESGILKLVIPKRNEAKSNAIEIKVS